MPFFASTFRYLQRKKYQYEVTSSLYMMTPTEKFIFNSFLFLFFSMVLIAASLYLPHHITFLTNRAWFYYHGDEKVAVVQAVATSSPAVERMATATVSKLKQVVETVMAESAKAAEPVREL